MKSLNILVLFRSTHGSTKVDPKMAETDMRLKQWAMIRILDWWNWEANFNSHIFTQSEWWSYYGYLYFWKMGKMR